MALVANKFIIFFKYSQKVVYLTKETIDKTPEGTVLDNLRLTNVCCRRHMLTHVDVE